MISILKSDFYRLGKNKLLYSTGVFISMIAFFLTMLINRNIRLGISVFGNLTTFKNIGDILRIGIEYYKGLGVLAAVLISIFIGQEYQWETWGHKWSIKKNRIHIYLSKAILSSTISVVIFLLFEFIVVIFSGQIQKMMTTEYIVMILCGIFIYTALGSILCLLSILIRNNTASPIVCICYVLFSETLISLIKNVSRVHNIIEKGAEWLIQHSLYGMSVIIRDASVSTNQIITVSLNSFFIILLFTMVGILFFRRYEF